MLGNCAGRIARRTQEQQLAALPDFGRHAIEIGQIFVVAVVAHEPGLCAGEQRGAFVDLIERIRHHDQRLRRARSITACANANSASRVPLTGSTIVSGIDGACGQAETPRQPVGDGAAQLRHAGGRPDSCRGRARFCGQRIAARTAAACGAARRSTWKYAADPAGGCAPASSARSRSNGYGCSCASAGFMRGGRAFRSARCASRCCASRAERPAGFVARRRTRLRRARRPS